MLFFNPNLSFTMKSFDSFIIIPLLISSLGNCTHTRENSEPSPSKEETQNWILSTFRKYSYVYSVRQTNNDIPVQYSNYQFDFKKDYFLITYLVEKDYGKKSYQEQAQLPIKNIEYIVYYGSWNPTLEIFSKGETSFVIKNLSTNDHRWAHSLSIGFWMKEDEDAEIGNRLIKAFGHIQDVFMKPEPF
jgi:hypothetical protein